MPRISNNFFMVIAISVLVINFSWAKEEDVINNTAVQIPQTVVRPSVNINTIIIVGAQSQDSLGTDMWKDYFDSSSLIEVWFQEDYFWGRYQALKLLTAVGRFRDSIVPRYSRGEISSVEEIRNIMDEGVIDNHTVVIVDMGGAHSVAIAMELVRVLGFRPVVLADVDPFWPGGSCVHAIQELATLLYFSAELSQLKSGLRADAPPVFILDFHRDSSPSLERPIDNSYEISRSDLPTAQELIAHGIRKVVIIRESLSLESDMMYVDSVDFGQRIIEYFASGIEVKISIINPWPDLDVILDELLKLRLSR